ncbi:MAG: RNA-binding protein [Clostridia bacterium]|nr:RNA-binding protein [Clostridia bacterium]
MSKKPILPGAVVVSKAGRDEGRTFLVIAELSDEYVLIADGKTHRIEKPKKKKRKHLKLAREPITEIVDRLSQRPMENYEVRAYLSDKEE